MDKFEQTIIAEIKEVGEFAFVFLIPIYRECNLGIRIKYPITDFTENYMINEKNFIDLINRVKRIIADYNLGIFKDIGYSRTKSPKNWNDCFSQLDIVETENFINNNQNWIYNKHKSGYFLSEID